MIPHTKYLLILMLLLCFSCKQRKIALTDEENNEPKITEQLQESKTFTFYKSFSFCESEVTYFTDKEARDIYSDKRIEIDIKDGDNINISNVYNKEKLSCISKNLELNGNADAKIFKTKDAFPFDGLVLLNNKYLIVSRDGYFFVFTTKETNKKNIVTNENLSPQTFKSLLNCKIVGLSIINEQTTDPYKKYGLDFSTICYCNSPAIFINTKSKEFIIFNYCDSNNNNSIQKIKNKSIYKIIKIEYEGDKMMIITIPHLKITYQKKDKVPIFQMYIEGDFPTKYVGGDLKNIFTPEPEKFQKTDCEDFGG